VIVLTDGSSEAVCRLPWPPRDRAAALARRPRPDLRQQHRARVCLLLREQVPGIDPFVLIRHSGLTLTVAQPRPAAATVRDYAGLPASGDGDTGAA
jgi:hypothetical protein